LRVVGLALSESVAWTGRLSEPPSATVWSAIAATTGGLFSSVTWMSKLVLATGLRLLPVCRSSTVIG